MPEGQKKHVGGRVDGRTRRAEQNRQNVARAMLELVREGVVRPTRERVAERADVSLRSVYHHYANLEDLYEEACRIQFLSIRHLTHDLPPFGDGSTAARIAAFAARRAELYERITPVRRSAMHWIHRSTALAEGIAGLAEGMREQLAGTFEKELAPLAGRRRETLLDALEAATSWEAWDFMRDRKHFSAPRAQRALSAVLHGLLNAA